MRLQKNSCITEEDEEEEEREIDCSSNDAAPPVKRRSRYASSEDADSKAEWQQRFSTRLL
jgi:hypothetical protein